MNKFFRFIFIFLFFFNFLLSDNYTNYLLKIINKDLTNEYILEKKESKSIKSIEKIEVDKKSTSIFKRILTIETIDKKNENIFKGLNIKYPKIENKKEKKNNNNIDDKEFSIDKYSMFTKYKNFIEEFLIEFFDEVLEEKDKIEKEKKNLNLAFIKIFIVKLLTDYFPLNLKENNFKNDDIKKIFLYKFYEFYLSLIGKKKEDGDNENKQDKVLKLKKFKNNFIENKRDLLDFYSEKLIENLASDDFEKLEYLNYFEKLEYNYDNNHGASMEIFFENKLLPFLGCLIKKFNVYNSTNDYYKKEFKVIEKIIKKQKIEKKKLEKVIKKILNDFFFYIKYNKESYLSKIEKIIETLNKSLEVHNNIEDRIQYIYYELNASLIEKSFVKKEKFEEGFKKKFDNLKTKVGNKRKNYKEKFDNLKTKVGNKRKNYKEKFDNLKTKVDNKRKNYKEKFDNLKTKVDNKRQSYKKKYNNLKTKVDNKRQSYKEKYNNLKIKKDKGIDRVKNFLEKFKSNNNKEMEDKLSLENKIKKLEEEKKALEKRNKELEDKPVV